MYKNYKGNDVGDKVLFFDTLDKLFWEDSNKRISASLVHTEPIREIYIQSKMLKFFPTYPEIYKWMGELGYTRLGRGFVRSANKMGVGKGLYFTKYPDHFQPEGVTDWDAVRKAVHRRELYLKVKPFLSVKTKYSIGEVREVFGVSLNTIREWDRKGLLPAMRSEGGHRRYNLGELVNHH